MKNNYGVDDLGDLSGLSKQFLLQANKRACQYIQENRERLFPLNATVSCLTHDARCFVNPFHALKQHHGARSGDSPCSDGSIHNAAWWEDPSLACDAGDNGLAPLVINMGSPPCVDYAGPGGQANEAGHCELLHYLWVEERVVAAQHACEDVYFTEKVVQYPLVRLHKSNETSHTCRHTLVCRTEKRLPN